MQFVIAGRDAPVLALALDSRDRRVQEDTASRRAQSPEKNLQQAIGVDVSCIRFEHAANNRIASQDRHFRQDIRGGKPCDAGCQAPRALEGVVQDLDVACSADMKRAPRRKDRRIGKARRWAFKKCATRARKRPDRRIPVDFREQSSGSARRMIARLRLSLDQCHQGSLGDMRRHRSAGYPTANDGDIELHDKKPSLEQRRIARDFPDGQVYFRSET
jgi:hypothetical protein